MGKRDPRFLKEAMRLMTGGFLIVLASPHLNHHLKPRYPREKQQKSGSMGLYWDILGYKVKSGIANKTKMITGSQLTIDKQDHASMVTIKF